MEVSDIFCTRAEQEQLEKMTEAWLASLTAMPELGFQEVKTSAWLLAQLQEHFPDAAIQTGLALTGLIATLELGPAQPGCKAPHIALICEMDSIICPAHPEADPASGAAHACGHHFQIAVALCAFMLVAKLRAKGVCGRVSLYALPAEEYADFAFREELCRKGSIRSYSGKQEFIRLGLFRDVDAALMVHAHPNSAPCTFYTNGTSLGFTAKNITFTGKAAHASTPWLGINALNAATIALQCIHASRELFPDEDHIRIHPIITHGGDLVNVVPEKVQMETFVRGASLPAIQRAAAITDRALQGAASAMGAKVDIQNKAGYLPLMQSTGLTALFERALGMVPGLNPCIQQADLPGSTDMGDLSHLLPCIHPGIGGFAGNLHTSEFAIQQAGRTTVNTAMALAATTALLLANNGEELAALQQGFTPLLTEEEYLRLL